VLPCTGLLFCLYCLTTTIEAFTWTLSFDIWLFSYHCIILLQFNFIVTFFCMKTSTRYSLPLSSIFLAPLI
jgi:hypothetical protein